MKSDNVKKWILRYTLAYPVLLPAVLYATWVIAGLSLGKWPRPSVDDPKYINMAVSCAHSFVLFLGTVGLLIFMVLVVFSLGWGLLQCLLKRPRGLRLAGYACLSMVLLIVSIRFIYWDPLSVFNWFMD